MTSKSEKPLSKLVPRNQHLFLACVVVLSMVHPLTLGYDSLMTGGILNLASYLSYFDLNTATIGLNNAVTWVGQVVACISITQYLSDKFGRKIAILVGINILFIGVAIQSAAQHIAMFIVGRFLLGFGGSITNISAIVLVAELCPVNKRGFTMGLAFSSFLIGSLISSGVTYGARNAPGNWNWRIPSIVQGVFTIVALINLIFLPESPRFLLAQGYDLQAYETFMIIENEDVEKATSLIEEIRMDRERIKIMNKDFHPWKTFFKSRINVHRTVINFTHAILEEMGGSSVGSYYLAILLQQAGISSSDERLQVNVVMSAWQLVCATSGCLLLDRIGRKTSSMVSLVGMVVTFLILGGLVKKYGNEDNRSGSLGSVAVMFLFSGFYSFTYTPMTTLYPSELYPFVLRSTGTTLFNVFNGIFGLIASMVLPIAMDSIGWKFYIINGAYDAVFVPIIYYAWVETKGVDIEAIDELFWQHPFNINHRSVNKEPSIYESDSVEVQSVEVVQKV